METLGVQTLLELDQKISTFVLLIGHLRHLLLFFDPNFYGKHLRFLKNAGLIIKNSNYAEFVLQKLTFYFVMLFSFVECKLHCFQFVGQIGVDENICIAQRGGGNTSEALRPIELLLDAEPILDFFLNILDFFFGDFLIIFGLKIWIEEDVTHWKLTNRIQLL